MPSSAENLLPDANAKIRSRLQAKLADPNDEPAEIFVQTNHAHRFRSINNDTAIPKTNCFGQQPTRRRESGNAAKERERSPTQHKVAPYDHVFLRLVAELG